MTGILADVNAQGHLRILLGILQNEYWNELWASLNLAVPTFDSLGWPYDLSDRVIWQECQQRGIVLVTANRNRKGYDSLEEAVRSLNTPTSLPVITLANAKRLGRSKAYAERVAEKLLDYLLNIDQYRGAGRLYVP